MSESSAAGSTSWLYVESQGQAVGAKGNDVFRQDYKERMAMAAVLAALSAVPISLGLATSHKVMHFFWLAIGLVLWVVAIALLYPDH